MRKHYGRAPIDKFLTRSYLSPDRAVLPAAPLGVAFCLLAAQIVLHNLMDIDGGQGQRFALDLLS
jgi:hypothetical protein